MSSQSHSKSNQLDLKITRISRFEFNSKGIFSSDTIVSPLCYLEIANWVVERTCVKHPILSLFQSIMMSQKQSLETRTILSHVFPTRSTLYQVHRTSWYYKWSYTSCSGSHLRDYESRQIESALNLLYSITFTNSYQIYSTTNLYR